jgi:hypothetical protein
LRDILGRLLRLLLRRRHPASVLTQLAERT